MTLLALAPGRRSSFALEAACAHALAVLRLFFFFWLKQTQQAQHHHRSRAKTLAPLACTVAKEGAPLGILLTLAEGIVKAPVILGLCLSVPCSRMLLRRATNIAQSTIPRLHGRDNSKTGPAPLQPPVDLSVRRITIFSEKHTL